MDFSPFANSTSSAQIDDLTLENQGDRLSIYGSIQITLDKEGLVLAQALQQVINQTVVYLSQQELPDTLPAPEEAEEIDNPFWKD